MLRPSVIALHVGQKFAYLPLNFTYSLLYYQHAVSNWSVSLSLFPQFCNVMCFVQLWECPCQISTRRWKTACALQSKGQTLWCGLLCHHQPSVNPVVYSSKVCSHVPLVLLSWLILNTHHTHTNCGNCKIASHTQDSDNFLIKILLTWNVTLSCHGLNGINGNYHQLKIKIRFKKCMES